jgi:hypothetical protein
MLDRDYLRNVAGLTPEQREEAMLAAVAAAGFVADPELGRVLAALRDKDPNLRVREAAATALRSGTRRAGASPSP